ncbi:hypothetical protein FACS189485_16430 [Spirochaetia bacterium]|nr:hypothetical protein FACS189485_16430 [Spirochaetia bacterium]
MEFYEEFAKDVGYRLYVIGANPHREPGTVELSSCIGCMAVNRGECNHKGKKPYCRSIFTICEGLYKEACRSNVCPYPSLRLGDLPRELLPEWKIGIDARLEEHKHIPDGSHVLVCWGSSGAPVWLRKYECKTIEVLKSKDCKIHCVKENDDKSPIHISRLCTDKDTLYMGYTRYNGNG